MQQRSYTATTLFGLEPILAKELEQIGAHNIQKHNRVVSFEGDKELLYKANLWLRTALRILVLIDQFEVTDEEELYKAIQKIDWSQYLELEQTFAIDAIVNSGNFPHSKYPALKAKDAIVDQFRSKLKRRPSIDKDQPGLRINLHIYKDDCTVSLDSSGDSLHMRGYRMEKVAAPLNEVLAAGMVQMTGWDGKVPLVDPMCGSGTIAIEAALLAANKAPGLIKKEFGFMRWKDYDKTLWEKLVREAEDTVTPISAPVMASDKSPKAVSITQNNLERAGLENVMVQRIPFHRLQPPEEAGILVMNPPYGERLKENEIINFYKKIGDTLKQNWTGYTAWILSSNKEAIKRVGLRTSQKETLYNGPLVCKFHKFELY